ncbi:MAG: cell division protein FtsH, partial [candidate division NC10 bacterium]|nr:cell division protein FtsH [candidate division NC10 bacterium]
MEKKQWQFALWYFVAAFFLVLAVHDFLIARHTETLSYSDFKLLLKSGKVEDLTLGTHVISGRLKREGLEGLLSKEKVEAIQRLAGGENRFVTIRVNDPTLIQELEALKVRFAGEVESTWFTTLLSWVLPALVFVGVWAFLMKRVGGPASGL